MSTPRHRIQDFKHHLPDNMQRSRFHSPEQIQNETQRPKIVLSEHGGDCT